MLTLLNRAKKWFRAFDHYQKPTCFRKLDRNSDSYSHYVALLTLVLVGLFCGQVGAETVAYWRFDDMTDAEIIAEAGTVSAGNALPDSDGQTVWRKAAHDYSGNGNHLTTWEYAWAGHEWSDDIPDSLVTTLGLENRLSITSAGSYPAMMTWSEESEPTGVDLETWSPEQFTIEASFKLTDISGYHTIVGRDGNDVATDREEPALAPFYLSLRSGTGTLGVLMTDVDGYTHVVESEEGFIETNTWYNVAVVSDGETLSLYADNVLINSVDMTESGSSDTRLAVGETSGDGWESGAWTVTRGLYNGEHTDRVYGWVDEIRISDEALSPAEFLFGKASPRAQDPYPAQQETEAAQDLILHWSPGLYEATHDLYFGSSEDELSALATDLDVNQFYLGRLEFEQTYYWRVDEVNVTSDHTVTTGEIWSFTVEPEAYAIDGNNIVATASSSYTGSEPQSTVDASGLNDDDQHGTSAADMWVSSADDEGPVWIEYAFDQIYNLHELWVWNSNQEEIEVTLGFGIRSAQIEVSTDGENWTVFAADTLILPALGEGDSDVSSVIDLGGVQASHVRLTALSNWSSIGVTQYGLSEVRFYSISTDAHLPQPADGATDVAVTNSLSWRSGRKAAIHDVFFSAEENAATLVGQVDMPAFDLSGQGVTYGQTYYWRVDEVNEDDSLTCYPGEVWSFSTPDYVLLDDMESYSDSLEIFETWVDGYGISGNGSQVGHEYSPYVEQVIAYQGTQSMPFSYINTSSEIFTAERDMDHDDWSEGGLESLVMYVLGDSGNAAGPLFIEINGERADVDLDLTVPIWTPCCVDLTALDIDLSDIETLVIGVDGVGNGELYLDEIRLYHEAPAMPVAQDPGQEGLVLWYEMEGNLEDSAGNYDGSSEAAYLSYEDGLDDMGQALELDGSEGYVDMPIGELMAGLTDSSFTVWVKLNDSEASWQRAFDVGTGTDNYLFLCPRMESDGVPRTAIITTESDTETVISSEQVLSEDWHHFAVVFDANSLIFYVDGRSVGQEVTPDVPANLGETTQNWLGDSQWEADDFLDGLLDDFRIYNRALSEGEIRYLAGDQ